MIKISDFMLPSNIDQRVYYLNDKPIMSLGFLPNGIKDGKQAYIVKQYDWDEKAKTWAWSCNWLMRLESDGSFTEYADEYPKTSFDWFSTVSKLTFMKGHEIQWAENASGSLYPNPFQTSINHIGTFGTFTCKAMNKLDNNKNVIQDEIGIYMEQKFNSTDRAMYHCRKGYGIYAITYYTDKGDSATISDTIGFVPSGN